MEFGITQGKLTIVVFTGLTVLILSWLILTALERRRRIRQEVFAERPLAARLTEGFKKQWRKPLNVLVLLGILFVLIALTQPKWGHSSQTIVAHRRTMWIALDVSESMKATDVLPNRLERAKQKISALMELFPGDEFGLVVFAGTAAVITPCTIDHSYFQTLLHSVDTDMISVEGTDIGKAFLEIINILAKEKEEKTPYDPNSKAVILLSDGEDNNDKTIEITETLANYSRIFVIGVGTPDGGIIQFSPKSPAEKITESHLSILDENKLIKIATVGRGAYARTQADFSDINQIAESLKSIRATLNQTEKKQILINRFQIFLGLGILCFILESILYCSISVFRNKANINLVKIKEQKCETVKF